MYGFEFNWFKSTFSDDFNQGCVEVRFFEGGLVMVRHSRFPQGPTLVFNRAEWEAFLLGAVHGQFAMP